MRVSNELHEIRRFLTFPDNRSLALCLDRLVGGLSEGVQGLLQSLSSLLQIRLCLRVCGIAVGVELITTCAEKR